MRDPNRLYDIYNLLLKGHMEVCPDQRFGQFMSNFLGWCLTEKKCNDIFFPEDDKWVEWIKEYFKL